MSIKILAFGIISEVIGVDEIILENLIDSEALKTHLLKTYPQLRNYTFQIAINQNILDGKQKLHENDTVALMPPFAGG